MTASFRPGAKGKTAMLGWSALLLALSLPVTSRAIETEQTIELPPMIVTEGKDAPPWRYVAAPGIEVLSRCDDSITADFVERNQRLTELVRFILPDALQFRTTLPKTTVLVDGGAASSLSQNLVTQFGSGKDGGGLPTAPNRIVRMLPNLELDDVDALALFAVVDRRNFDGNRLVFTPNHIRFVLGHRVPPLPAWFIEGFARVFTDLEFRLDTIRMPPLTWQSQAATRQLDDDADAPRAVLPLVDFFSAARHGVDEIVFPWRAEAELFVRWSLVTPERRAALARFVTAAAVQGETEPLLREAYGHGFADIRDQLSDYLPRAIKEEVTLEPKSLAPPPRLDIRDATAAEIGRVKGEWERLEISYVRNHHPEYAPQYVELARHTYELARQTSPSDPQLLSGAGLLELDAGNPDAARGLLELSASLKPARPQVYAALAALRLGDALKSGAAPEGQISPGQAAMVAETLQLARAQEPPMVETYALLAEAWYRSGIPLQRADLDLLERGITEFPQSPRLLYFSALLCALHGSIDTSLSLTERGLALNAPAVTHARFVALKAALLKAKAPSAAAAGPGK